MTPERFMSWLKRFQAELNDEFTNGPAKDLTQRPAFYTLRQPRFVYDPEGDYWLIDEDGNATNPRWELAILKYDYPHELLYLACEDRAGLTLSCYGYCNGDIVGGCQCEPLEIDSKEAAKKLQESDPFLFDAALDCIYIDDHNEWDWWRAKRGLTPPCMERGNIEDVELTHAFFLTRKSAERHIKRYYHNSETRCSGAINIWHNPDLQRLVVFMSCLDLNESTLVIDENRLTRLAEN